MRFLKSAWVGTVSVGVLACGSPAAPTNAVAPDLIVATGMNVVPIGSTTRFTVTAFTHSSSPNSYFTGVQQTADVSGSATWSSDNPAVVAVTSRNIVGRAAGTANVTASYMGSEDTIAGVVVGPRVVGQRFVGAGGGGAERVFKGLIGRA